MNFKKKILLLWVIFALLDPYPDADSESRSAYPIDPDPIRIRIRNPARKDVQATREAFSP
jgi:hypothetical protein